MLALESEMTTSNPLHRHTCWRLPRLVNRLNAIVSGSVDNVVGRASLVSTVPLPLRSFFLIGRGTSNIGLRSNLRESRLSAVNLASSRSNSASASGSRSSSWRVTTIFSSSDSNSVVSGGADA